ncbi:MAG TPA: ERAP1-like C-terminal domain-containing protein, partial [Actinomycetota bacterium]|nr:ERAP1-like C-terminal domain-containing protein [Actinomycetota bacterium]
TETILHELSHMWFGDLVTMKWWDDLWLNESFATYISNYAMEKATRWANAWTFFASRWKAAAYLQDQLPTTHPIAADAPDIATAESNFDAISYAKGASVLKQLVAWVGEKPFIEGVRHYFKENEFGNATLQDFLSSLESSSGKLLSHWSREWLQTSGVNILSLDTEIEDGRYTAAHIVQEVVDDWSVQRSHRLGLGLYDFESGGLVRRKYLEADATDQRTEVSDLRGEKVPDLLLVNDEDLAYSRIRLDEGSIKSLTTGLRLLDDSLARSLCWSATWDMMRSAEMPARQYLDLVLNNIDTETDVGLAQTSIARMQTAIYLYVAPQNREEHLRRITDYALQAARSAEAGGDFQLNWFTTFVSLAKAPEHLETLSQFLSGEEQLPGLDIDFARRWQIVMRLVAMGTAEEQLIVSELEREPTDQAERNAETARTLIPTAAAKQTAWKTVVDHPETSRATVLAIATGFMHPEQTELLIPFVDRFFEVAESVWTSRPREVAEIFPLGFFPRLIIDQSVIDRCDRFLSDKDADSALERKIIEARESVARALKVREADEAYEAQSSSSATPME